MIRLKKISKPEVVELVRISYEGDTDMLEKYHIHEFSLEDAVSVTMEILEIKSIEQKLDYYKVMYKDKPIGFIATYKKCLYSFGMAMKYRVKNILIEWFDNIKKVIGKDFITELYDNNTRAIEHLQRQGMKIIFKDPIKRVVTLQNF